MKLIAVSETEKSEYNRFVANSQTGSFLQAWEWGQWQQHLGREIFYFWLSAEDGKKIGALLLIKMPLPFGKYYLYAPYGPVTDLNFKEQNFCDIKEQLRIGFPRAVFLRLEPKSQQIKQLAHQSISKSKNVQPGKTLVVDLIKSPEELLAGMHHKTRYNIRLAEKHGVEIKDEFAISVGHGLFAQEAAELIVQTAQRQGYKGYDKNYYEQLLNFFALNNSGAIAAHVYKAVYQEQLLASAIMLDFGQTRTFLFGGSAVSNKNVMAPYLLHWQALLSARAAGLKNYDFWGSETSAGSAPGFVRFKQGFGGQEISYAGAYDICFNPFWYKGYQLFKSIKNSVH